MNVIKYNVNSGDVCQIGRQYEYGKTQVIFEGYHAIDSANEIYFKFVGRTDDSKYLIPIVDMTLDITQQLTKHVGQFSCQLEEMNTEGTLVSQSPVFYVAIKRSIKVGADYEVQDPRLETIYQKYNEMYNIISQTNETSLANESQRQAEWLTLKQEVSDAIDSFNADIAIGEFRTLVQTETDNFNTNAETKFNAYNQNDSQKTNTYNTNATEKLNAYNANADNRVLEFNAQTGQIQADISELKSDLTLTDLVVKYSENSGYLSENGSIASASGNKEKYTSLIPIEPLETIGFSVKHPSSVAMWIACGFYDSEQNFLDRIVLYSATNDSYVGEIKTGNRKTAYFSFTYRSYDNAHVTLWRKPELTSFNSPELPRPEEKWIRYSNGEVVASSATQMYTFNDILPKRIKAFLTSDTNALCAIGFFNSATISQSAFMQSSSVAFVDGNYNLGRWYDAIVPDGCKAITIVTKVPSDSVASPIILFDSPNIIDTLNENVQNHEKYIYTPDAFSALKRTLYRYIRYSDGEAIDTGSYLSIYSVANNNFRKVQARLYSTDDVPAMIAFYSSEMISSASYMKSASIQGAKGWRYYEADVPDGCKLIVFTHRNDYSSGSGTEYIKFIGSDFSVGAMEKALSSEEISSKVINHALETSFRRFKKCYDHLFVDATGSSVKIPHESLYHVRISKALGFNCIEANIAPTSDGVYIVNHLNAGKFGGYFHHVDGETDISDIAVSSVTWDWVVQNVRYNSQIPKYRTRPCRLEEFLAECRQQDIFPFVGRAQDANVIALADKYMGKGNYIAYGGNRTTCPDGIIYQWVSNLTTKADILACCDSYGRPFIYGMGNVSSFTDEELKDIVDTLHEHGYWIGTSYADTNWHKYSAMGFDMNGTQGRVNRIESGNIANLDSIYGFDDFTVINAEEMNGVLSFNSDGTITPNIDDLNYNVCMVDVEIDFNGSIKIPTVGEHTQSAIYTNDGAIPFFASIPIINGSPKFAIQVMSGTTINDISFKVSKV